MSEYLERQANLQSAIESSTGPPVRLDKKTSNLFRDRSEQAHHRLDVSDFDHVLEVNTDEGWVDVEGMTPYDVLVEHTLSHGVMPCVVPQLKSITIGGALAGIGIESSSFRYGLTHETLREFDVLLGDGSVVTCSPHNQHSDLFFGFPNSYGTLGYALRIRASTIRTKPYVALIHYRYRDRDTCFAQLQRLLDDDIDFLDGAVYGANELILTTGRLRRRGALHQRLHLRGHLLPLPATAHGRFPDHGRIPLALGHRLVLVLQEPRRPESAGPSGSGAQPIELAFLHPGDALEQSLAGDETAGALRPLPP